MTKKIPFRATIDSVEQCRYGTSLKAGQSRPLSWDERKGGIDVVKTDDGQTLRLLSDGQQSVPQHGWVILVTDGDNATGYQWTLFGLPKGSEVHTY